MNNVEHYLENGEVIVLKETFAIAKVKNPLEGVFASISDSNEHTAVIDQSKLEKNTNVIIEVDKDWKILTFDMLLPLNMVGFIAAVSSELAKENISILWLSAYSTDHVLIQQEDLAKAIAKLTLLGCRIKQG